MNLRYIVKDGKNILQYCNGIGLGGVVWEDVPTVEEKQVEKDWCRHIKETESFSLSSRRLVFREYGQSDGYNISEDWKACPICGAKRPE